MGIVTYNGRSSLEYQILVEEPPEYQTPERDYETIHVPGRNGDIFMDTGAYKNVERKYKIAIGSPIPLYTGLAAGVAKWLHSANGYARLEDTYEPDFYRLALFKDAVDLENLFMHMGRAEIVFDCMPQRFLKIGDEPIQIRKATTLLNHTDFAALPLITLTGSGDVSIMVGGSVVEVTGLKGSVVIDSEMQDAYSGDLNMNPQVKVTGGFPVLLPGDNEISYEGDMTSVEVVPKWWTL